MTNMMTMPVVAIEWMSGASRLRTVQIVVRTILSRRLGDFRASWTRSS